MRMRGLTLASAVLTLCVVPADVHAQNGFMFGQPKGQLTLRAGPVLHRAGGDLLGFFQSELTLERGDFRAPSIGAELSLVMHPRLDVSVGASWSNAESGSEFREWVDENDLPIEQTTSLRVVPLTASVRFYPLSRGTGISELAWVPARTTPYIGAGAGIAWHTLRQSGDFVSEDDLSIYTAEFESTGRDATGHVFAGLDHWFTPHLGANLEGRYMFGSANPTDDFATWDSIDLSGLHMGIGLALRW